MTRLKESFQDEYTHDLRRLESEKLLSRLEEYEAQASAPPTEVPHPLVLEALRDISSKVNSMMEILEDCQARQKRNARARAATIPQGAP